MLDTLKNNVGTTVAFGDVIQLSKASSKDPVADGFERYVGLEHLEPSDLKVRSWGNIADGITFTKVFKPGQVLFGKRRAYQRKVAVAGFSGVCSGDIYVLEPKGDELLPELLPFICQSESFYDYVISMSQGGLSPRVNWKALAKYEFALPPLEEQRRITEVLQAAETNRVSLLNLAFKASCAVDSLVDNRMRGIDLASLQRHERIGQYHGNWALTPLGDLLENAQYGLSENPLESGHYPILRMMNLAHGKVTEDDLKYVDLSVNEFLHYRLKQGDVLFNRTNSHELVGRSAVYDLRGDHVFASYLIRLNTRPTQLLPGYLSAYLNAPIGRRQVMSFATRGVSQTNVNASNLKRILIPLPPINYQRRVVDLLAALHAAQAATVVRCAATSSISKKIINGMLSG